MIDDRDLDRLLEQSAPRVDDDEARQASRAAFAVHRSSRSTAVRGRRAVTLVLIAGGAVGIGATAAAVDGASLAAHLGWKADTTVHRTTGDGNECELGFRAMPETGLIHQPPTPADHPAVLAAQAYLRTLDVASIEVTAEDVEVLKRGYADGDHQGSGEQPEYTDAYFEIQALFVAVVDAVTAELASQGLAVDGVVAFEGANECTEQFLRPVSTTPGHFDQVVQANGPDLYAYLARRLTVPSDAGDALSEVFAAAWRRRSKLPVDETEARMWLFAIAANVLRNIHRGQRRHRSMLDRLRQEAEVSSGLREDAGVAETVQEAIQRLPSGQAEIVRLRHWEGFTLDEAAQLVGIPASTARSRYAAAREQLRQLLSHQGQSI